MIHSDPVGTAALLRCRSTSSRTKQNKAEGRYRLRPPALAGPARLWLCRGAAVSVTVDGAPRHEPAQVQLLHHAERGRAGEAAGVGRRRAEGGRVSDDSGRLRAVP